MSSFIGYISKDHAFIATDTLCSFLPLENDTELIPRSYTCKVFSLPQYKSCFAVTGSLQAGLCFFNDTVEFTSGMDIDSLINIDLKHFQAKLRSNCEKYPKGTIHLIGYSSFHQSFRGFKLILQPGIELKWAEILADTLFFKPAIADWQNKLAKAGPPATSQQFITNLMKLQKNEDAIMPVKSQVGVGGEVVFTLMEINNVTKLVTTNIQVVHQFEDYFELGHKMANFG